MKIAIVSLSNRASDYQAIILIYRAFLLSKHWLIINKKTINGQ